MSPERPAAPFRVLMLSGASSVHTIRWANAFAAKGVDLHLVTQHDPIDTLDPRISLHRLPHVGGLGYLSNGPRLRALVNDISPDVVNAHYATGYGTLSRWVGRTPLVLNVWGSDVYDFPEQGPLHRRLLRGNLRRADVVVSTSEAMAQHTRELCPDLRSLLIVPFGVDTDHFHPAPPRSASGPLVIGTVKTLEPVYGVDLLVQAFIQLVRVEGEVPLRLRIVGGGSERARLEAMLQEAGLSDRAVFTGRVPHDRVPEELRQLDIYAAFSRSESFGVAVIEASACGLPVVVSDVGGLPEVVERDVTGSVVPDGDVHAAVAALLRLVEDAALRTRFGQAGRERVMDLYGWDRCVERMLQVLRQAGRPIGAATVG